MKKLHDSDGLPKFGNFKDNCLFFFQANQHFFSLENIRKLQVKFKLTMLES